MDTELKQPSEVLPPEPPQTSLTYALYVNGRLAPCDDPEVTEDSYGGLTITFKTTRTCAEAGSGNPRIERAWKGKQAGVIYYIQQPDGPNGKYPPSGSAQLVDVKIPANEGDTVMYLVTPVTPITDWSSDSLTPLAQAGEDLYLPEDWIGERA